MSEWQSIESAQKDGTRADLWAKTWLAEHDKFIGRRFPNCYWTNGDSMTNRRASWVNLDSGWVPTHWMPLPQPPENAP